MTKLNKFQWIIIVVAVLNLSAFIIFVVDISQYLIQTFDAIYTEHGELFSLNLTTIPLLIVFHLFIFVIVNFVLFYLFNNFAKNRKSSKYLIFLYCCCIFTLLFYFILNLTITIKQASGGTSILLNTYVSLISSFLYIIFFIWCLIVEIKLKKHEKENIT